MLSDIQATSTILPLTNEPLFFCFHSEQPHGFLCQWYPSVFTAPSSIFKSPMTFVCAEQYMMYQKAMLFKDTETATLIMATECPAEHQALGRQVKGYQKALWYMNREKIVEDGNWNKFMNSSWLRNKLLKTGNRELVEASTDVIWGVGFLATHAETSRKEWGQNLLGKALMRVRARVREHGLAKCLDQENLVIGYQGESARM